MLVTVHIMGQLLDLRQCTWMEIEQVQAHDSQAWWESEEKGFLCASAVRVGCQKDNPSLGFSL